MMMTARRQRESRRMAPRMMPTRAPMLRVTAPLAVEEDGVSEVMPTVMPVVEDEAEVMAASPILLVKVLANVLVRVAVWTFAVMMTVYEEVKTENSFVSTEGGGV
jgi:hypothetical protein